MRFFIFFEGIFFSCFYSTAPFLALDLINDSVFHYHFHEPTIRKDIRYFFICSLAFILYYFYSILGYRTRYILWHLERPRYASGFIPVETMVAAVYHTFFLCFLSETLLPVIDGKNPALLSNAWLENLSFRLKHIFLFSIAEHSVLELTGFWDKIRREYFEIERD